MIPALDRSRLGPRDGARRPRGRSASCGPTGHIRPRAAVHPVHQIRDSSPAARHSPGRHALSPQSKPGRRERRSPVREDDQGQAFRILAARCGQVPVSSRPSAALKRIAFCGATSAALTPLYSAPSHVALRSPGRPVRRRVRRSPNPPGPQSCCDRSTRTPNSQCCRERPRRPPSRYCAWGSRGVAATLATSSKKPIVSRPADRESATARQRLRSARRGRAIRRTSRQTA